MFIYLYLAIQNSQPFHIVTTLKLFRLGKQLSLPSTYVVFEDDKRGMKRRKEWRMEEKNKRISRKRLMKREKDRDTVYT